MPTPPPRVALETTLLTHGVPRDAAVPLARELAAIVSGNGAQPALVGIHNGRAVAGLTEQQLADMLAQPELPKVNASNLGIVLHRAGHGATTVSATMEIAASAGIRVFATGGIGGIHKGAPESLDVSSDLTALSRIPVAVVTSGVKSILDIRATREALETLCVPVVGFKTDAFPAFYLRDGSATVDARFDDPRDLAAFVRKELARAHRGIVVANPIPAEDEIDAERWESWLLEAQRDAQRGGVSGRAVTPYLLARLHELSDGETLRANIALIKFNAALAARLAAAMA